MRRESLLRANGLKTPGNRRCASGHGRPKMSWPRMERDGVKYKAVGAAERHPP